MGAVIVESPSDKLMGRTSTLSGTTMATPVGRPPPRGKPLRVTPYGLHPPQLAAH